MKNITLLQTLKQLHSKGIYAEVNFQYVHKGTEIYFNWNKKTNKQTHIKLDEIESHLRQLVYSYCYGNQTDYPCYSFTFTFDENDKLIVNVIGELSADFNASYNDLKTYLSDLISQDDFKKLITDHTNINIDSEDIFENIEIEYYIDSSSTNSDEMMISYYSEINGEHIDITSTELKQELDAILKSELDEGEHMLVQYNYFSTGHEEDLGDKSEYFEDKLQGIYL